MTDWREEAAEYIDKLGALEPGWLESDTPPPSPRAVMRAKQALRLFAGRPGIFPTAEGFIAFEWNGDDWHAQLEFCGDEGDRFDEFFMFEMGEDR